MPAESLHDVRFPNESRAYREARNELLVAERELRRQIERVAAQPSGVRSSRCQSGQIRSTWRGSWPGSGDANIATPANWA
jgi:hypothetical protein